MDYLKPQSKVVVDEEYVYAAPTYVDEEIFPSFYAQLFLNDDLMVQIQKICNPETPNNIEPLPSEEITQNRLCLAKDTNGLFHRGLVKEVNYTSNTAAIFFFDFGNTETLPFSNIARFLVQLFCFPAQAYAMELTGDGYERLKFEALKVLVQNDRGIKFKIIGTRVERERVTGKKYVYNTVIPMLGEALKPALAPPVAPVIFPSTTVAADVAPLMEETSQLVLNDFAPVAVASTPGITMSNENPSVFLASTEMVHTARNANGLEASLAQTQQPAFAEPSLPIPVESNIAEPATAPAVAPEAPTTVDHDITAAAGGGSQGPVHISFVPQAQAETLPVPASEVPETSGVVTDILESDTVTTEDQSTTLISSSSDPSLSSTGLGVGATAAAPDTSNINSCSSGERGIFGGRGVLTDLEVQEIKDELLNDPVAFEQAIRGCFALRNMLDALAYHY